MAVLTLEVFKNNILPAFFKSRADANVFGTAVIHGFKEFCAHEDVNKWQEIGAKEKNDAWTIVSKYIKEKYMELKQHDPDKAKTFNITRSIIGYWKDKAAFRKGISTLLVKLCVSKKGVSGTSQTSIKEKCAVLGTEILDFYKLAKSEEPLYRKRLVLDIDSKLSFPFALFPDDPNYDNEKDFDVLSENEVGPPPAHKEFNANFSSLIGWDAKIDGINQLLDNEEKEFLRLSHLLEQKKLSLESLRSQLSHFKEQKRLEEENNVFATFTRKSFGDEKFSTNISVLSEILVAINMIERNGKGLGQLYEEILLSNKLNRTEVHEFTERIMETMPVTQIPSEDLVSASSSSSDSEEKSGNSKSVEGTRKSKKSDHKQKLRQKGKKHGRSSGSESDVNPNLKKKKLVEIVSSSSESEDERQCSTPSTSKRVGRVASSCRPTPPSVPTVGNSNLVRQHQSSVTSIIEQTMPHVTLSGDRKKGKKKQEEQEADDIMAQKDKVHKSVGNLSAQAMASDKEPRGGTVPVIAPVLPTQGGTVPTKAAETPAKAAETPAKAAETPFKPAETPAKAAETPANAAETSAKPTEAPAKTASVPTKTPQTQTKSVRPPTKVGLSSKLPPTPAKPAKVLLTPSKPTNADVRASIQQIIMEQRQLELSEDDTE